eukprot:522806-Pyramimonas_sp.AAC.1
MEEEGEGGRMSGGERGGGGGAGGGGGGGGCRGGWWRRGRGGKRMRVVCEGRYKRQRAGGQVPPGVSFRILECLLKFRGPSWTSWSSHWVVTRGAGHSKSPGVPPGVLAAL